MTDVISGLLGGNKYQLTAKLFPVSYYLQITMLLGNHKPFDAQCCHTGTAI